MQISGAGMKILYIPPEYKVLLFIQHRKFILELFAVLIR